MQFTENLGDIESCTLNLGKEVPVDPQIVKYGLSSLFAEVMDISDKEAEQFLFGSIVDILSEQDAAL